MPTACGEGAAIDLTHVWDKVLELLRYEAANRPEGGLGHQLIPVGRLKQKFGTDSHCLRSRARQGAPPQGGDNPLCGIAAKGKSCDRVIEPARGTPSSLR